MPQQNPKAPCLVQYTSSGIDGRELAQVVPSFQEPQWSANAGYPVSEAWVMGEPRLSRQQIEVTG